MALKMAILIGMLFWNMLLDAQLSIPGGYTGQCELHFELRSVQL